jgi:NADPH-dependent 2,4-dienoyl-CoA reductase/sulfur reductase-like enzyme
MKPFPADLGRHWGRHDACEKQIKYQQVLLKRVNIVIDTHGVSGLWYPSNFAAPQLDVDMKEKSHMSQRPVGSVMVVGGGIAGMQAALDLADSGYLVHLIEKSPAIGGVMSELDKTFPTNDCAM